MTDCVLSRPCSYLLKLEGLGDHDDNKPGRNAITQEIVRTALRSAISAIPPHR